MRLKERYLTNKEAKVGTTCICPSCSTKFVKEVYQQAFCKTKSGTKCKDKYWNTVTPEKRCNTTRISPANQDWRDKHINNDFDDDFDDDQGWDAHKDTF